MKSYDDLPYEIREKIDIKLHNIKMLDVINEFKQLKIYAQNSLKLHEELHNYHANYEYHFRSFCLHVANKTKFNKKLSIHEKIRLDQRWLHDYSHVHLINLISIYSLIKDIKQCCADNNIKGFSKINKNNKAIWIRKLYERQNNEPIGSNAKLRSLFNFL
uniref:Uncharacterized protein n=1 Tax=viral metagenome TaxID=1070528 RepID=A0A6C0FD33_9ZZZZ|tara:strand:- start:18638 stop:19117 length:480 start_codon:yes stop_codon:yes gene_type:complete